MQRWWAQNKWNYKTTSLDDIPNEEDDIHNEDSSPVVEVVEPNDIKNYKPNERVQIKVSSTGRFPLQKIDIFVNDVYLGTSQYPFNFSFTPKELDILKEENEIKVISYDSVYNRAETNSTFKVGE